MTRTRKAIARVSSSIRSLYSFLQEKSDADLEAIVTIYLNDTEYDPKFRDACVAYIAQQICQILIIEMECSVSETFFQLDHWLASDRTSKRLISYLPGVSAVNGKVY